MSMEIEKRAAGSENSQDVQLPGSSTREKNGFLQSLEDIEEDNPMYLPSPVSYPPPETPEEPMEFLSRTWSLSAIEVAKALAPDRSIDNRKHPRGTDQNNEGMRLDTAPFTFASTLTSKMVMDRILTPSELPVVAPRRSSHSNGPLICHFSGPLTSSPPPSPRVTDDLQNCMILPSLKLPFHGKSVRKWIKEMRERRKEDNRVQNAQVHAAVCVSAVAAAIAAVAAATASLSIDDGGTKTSSAVASAASLVAAHCVELAESMGADHQHVAAVVSSAVNVRTAGDVMTLTAAAATALRGAATLNARNSKETRKYATVAPYYSNSLSSDMGSEDSEAEYYTQEMLAKGCEFLKRSKSGELSWRSVYIFLDRHDQVVIKLQSTHIGGALKKTRKSIVLDVYPDIPAWPGRNLLENGEQRSYFGLKTTHGVTEFECRSVYLHKLWTQGIAHLLSYQHQKYLHS